MGKQGIRSNVGQPTSQALLNEIKELARKGRFASALRVREELLRLFPLELKAIVSSAYFIEEQMSLRIDQDHLAIWAQLYDQLALEEKNCLFHSLRKVTVPKGKLIIRQAKPETRLLFIDSGQVTLFHTRGNDRILLGQVSKGDLLGDETFFDLSTPTFSAGSQSEVQLYYLEKTDTRAWKKEHPGLYARLADFCKNSSRAASLIREKRVEKRAHERKKVAGRVKIKVLSEESLGANSYSFGVGSLVDISKGGVSFDIHSSQPENVRMLLGCQLDLAFQGRSEDRTGVLHLSGQVVRVGDLHYNDFMLHVGFASILSERDLEKVVRFIMQR